MAYGFNNDKSKVEVIRKDNIITIEGSIPLSGKTRKVNLFPLETYFGTSDMSKIHIVSVEQESKMRTWHIDQTFYETGMPYEITGDYGVREHPYYYFDELQRTTGYIPQLCIELASPRYASGQTVKYRVTAIVDD